MNTKNTLHWLRFQRILATLAPYIIALSVPAILFLVLQLDTTNGKAKETAAYTRASNCIVAKSAVIPELTQEDIEECYVQVEKKTGIHVERFDEQINGENLHD